MSKTEWLKIAAELQLRWPVKRIGDESLALWFDDLADLDAENVRAAVLAHYREGREWPPNGGQIRAKALELAQSDLDFGAAYGLTMRAAEHVGFDGGLDWLRGHSALAAEAADRYGWREFCHEPADDTTRRAQFRDIYLALARRQERARRYDGIPGVEANHIAPRSMKEILAERKPELTR